MFFILPKAGDRATERGSEDSENERSMPGNADEDSDDVFVQSSRPAATEDLFTIIHRYRKHRNVLEEFKCFW